MILPPLQARLSQALENPGCLAPEAVAAPARVPGAKASLWGTWAQRWAGSPKTFRPGPAGLPPSKHRPSSWGARKTWEAQRAAGSSVHGTRGGRNVDPSLVPLSPPETSAWSADFPFLPTTGKHSSGSFEAPDAPGAHGKAKGLCLPSP